MLSSIVSFALVTFSFIPDTALPSAHTAHDINGASIFSQHQEAASPADTLLGIDLIRLRNLVGEIKDEGTPYPDVHSLLVMRAGEIVLEEYFQISYADELHTIQSVSKSVTSAAIGIAIDEGLIAGVDEKVVDFFPDQRSELITNERRARMELADILTMRTGTDYNENGTTSPHWQLNALDTGWDDFWLARPMVNEPGGFWRYDSGGVITLSSMIKDRYGNHADYYIDEKLFGPLGITRRKWFRNQEHHPHTGGGLSMRSRDLAKFGQLFLQRGVWDGKQIVSEDWVDASFQRHQVFDPPIGTTKKIIGYGYLWWILSPDPEGDRTQNIYAAMGYRGQYIFVIPEHEMVVVVTGWMPESIYYRPVSFLYSDILPAVVAPISVSSERPEEPIRTGFLEQNAPNPAKGTSTIGFGVPTPGNTTVALYDLLGRRVKDVFNGFASNVRTEVSVDTSDLSPGVYIYRVESEDWTAAKKLLVSR